MKRFDHMTLRGRAWRRAAFVSGFIALLMIGLSAGLALSSEPAPADEEVETATLDAGTFQLDHPADWIEIEGPRLPLADFLKADYVSEHVVGIDDRNWLLAYEWKSPGYEQPTMEGAERYASGPLWALYDEITARTPGGAVGHPFEVEVAGMPGAYLSATFTEDGTPYQYRLLQVFGEDRGYTVASSYEYDQDRSVDFTIAFEDVQDSFRLVPEP